MSEHTDMTGAARLREALEEVGEALSMLSCPAYDGEGRCQSGCYQEPNCITGQPHGGWLAMATAGLESAFDVLDAVSETSERTANDPALRDVLERIAKRKPNQQDAAAAFYRCREDAREALAAVPEAPEPVYEWRALYDEDGESCTVSVASERGARLMATDGVHIERRTQAIPAGPWERVAEGTER